METTEEKARRTDHVLALTDPACAEPSPAPPAREPSTTRAQGSSHSFDDVTDAETRDLVAMATRNSFLTPVTSEEAVTFLRAIMGLELFV